ncbi:hypothetical protein [Zhouia amylolytica]|nr:hypothetical protein [Zhouia amylolytica]
MKTFYTFISKKYYFKFVLILILFGVGCQKEDIQIPNEVPIQYQDPEVKIEHGSIKDFKADITFQESLKKIKTNIADIKSNSLESKNKQNFL